MTARTRWGALVASATLVAAPVTAAVATEALVGSDQALVFDRLSPGSSGSGTIRVENHAESAGEVSLAAVVVAEEENGCLRPEVRAEGEACRADGGELGHWLVLTVERDGRQLWSGRMQDLTEPTGLAGSLPAGEVWDLDLTVGMPIEAGNETMTDRVAFDLEVITTTDTGEDTDVLGVEGSAPGGGTPGTEASVPTAVAAGLDRLRDAEVHHLLLLGASGLVVVAAGAMVIAERRRRRRW